MNASTADGDPLPQDAAQTGPEDSTGAEKGLRRVIGDQINWNSPTETIQLGVELPFWLLVQNGIVPVTVDGCTLNARIINNGVEVTSGTQTTRSHEKTIYIGDAEEGKSFRIPIPLSLEGGSAQFIRTFVEFETQVVSDALQAFTSDEMVRRLDGHSYMTAFALGHLPFLNHLINSYRRCTVDPYTSEVSQWDVPTWFVRTPAGPHPITIFPYPAQDTYSFFGGDSEGPYFATTLEDVGAMGQRDQLPGEIEMLDGWSLYYRGRYADSIRSFVTAIEVLLESKTREHLRARQIPPERLEKMMRETRNKFNLRLTHYCNASRRRLPGPVLHFVPYLNGFRLRLELEQTREMRHDIVHAGRRLDDSLSKPMRRVAETSTWFFDWMSESDFAERHARRYGFFAQHRGWPLFASHVEASGVVVTRPEEVDLLEIEDNKIRDGFVYSSEGVVGGYPQHLIGTLDKGMYGVRDIEHFTAIAFAMLGLDELEDSPPPPTGIDLPFFDRYRFRTGDICHLIYVVDTPEPLGSHVLKDVVTASMIRRREGLTIGATICVINDLNEVPWQTRDYNRGDIEFRNLISACALSVVRTDDLARLALGVRKYKWPKNAAFLDLVKVGLRGTTPPNATRIGHVLAYFPRINVLGIELTGGVEVKVGHLLAVRLFDGYYQCEITSMQQHGVAVESATFGQIGIKTEIAARVAIGASAYIVPPPPPLTPEAKPEEQSDELPPGWMQYAHQMTPDLSADCVRESPIAEEPPPLG